MPAVPAGTADTVAAGTAAATGADGSARRPGGHGGHGGCGDRGRYRIWPAFAIERASTDWISAKPGDETGLRPFCASSIEAFSSK